MAPFGVIIPARYASTRLPGKPLRDIAGRPMIAWVIDRARESGAAFVLVATDDERIAHAVERHGARAVLTSPAHPSGTDRLAEAAALEKLPPDTIVLNVQGDEPLLPPAAIRVVAQALAERPEAALATLAAPLHDVADLYSPHVVKVVLDQAGYARAFSRAPLPWVRDAFPPLPERPPTLPPGVSFLRHVGLYGYRVKTLTRLAASPVVPWERAESLEQLRALWLGLPIHVTVVDEAPPHGVDTEEDLERVRPLFLPG